MAYLRILYPYHEEYAMNMTSFMCKIPYNLNCTFWEVPWKYDIIDSKHAMSTALKVRSEVTITIISVCQVYLSRKRSNIHGAGNYAE